MATFLSTHGHLSLHSWPPFSALMATFLCTLNHLCTHDDHDLCTHGHPSLHLWSPFSAIMVTLLSWCAHGHPSLHSCYSFVHSCSLCFSLMAPLSHSWHHFSALLDTHGHSFSTQFRYYFQRGVFVTSLSNVVTILVYGDFICVIILFEWYLISI